MKRILVDQEQILSICKRLGKEISIEFKNEENIPVLVGVLKGSLNFMMDLLKFIEIPVFIDYVQISSYQGTKSTGRIRLVKDLSFDCKDRNVVIIEDIVDTGTSMHYLLEHIKVHRPKKIYVCSLFNKEAMRKEEVHIDFKGMELENNAFLIGYGLDYNELERNVPYVYEADETDIKRLNDILEKDKM